MHELSTQEVQDVSGGLPLFAPVALAMFAETAIYGPLGWAFGAGYAVGTLAYNYYSR